MFEHEQEMNAVDAFGADMTSAALLAMGLFALYIVVAFVGYGLYRFVQWWKRKTGAGEAL